MRFIQKIKENVAVVLAAVVLSQVVTAGIGLLAYKNDVLSISKESFEQQLQAAMEKQQTDLIKQQTAVAFKEYEAAVQNLDSDSFVYGDPEARFSIVSFSEFECPYCKRFHPTPKLIVDRSNGAVNWQWRHMPLSFHDPVATNEATAAECYAEQKGNRGFWVIAAKLFEKTAGNGNGVEDLRAIAQNLDADMSAFDSCMSSGKFKVKIDLQIAQGERAGATGTPASVVVDHKTGKTEFISGAQPASAFVEAMKKLISEDEVEQAKKEGRAVEDVSDLVQKTMLAPSNQQKGD